MALYSGMDLGASQVHLFKFEEARVVRILRGEPGMSTAELSCTSAQKVMLKPQLLMLGVYRVETTQKEGEKEKSAFLKNGH